MPTRQPLQFRGSDPTSLGIELELMLLDAASFDLAPVAVEVRDRVAERGFGARVQLEVTQSMIEVNSAAHASHGLLRDDLTSLVGELAGAAREHGARLCGSGTHPFHRWQERRISPSARFHEVAQLYGYLAKQFTVFGQHIHIGCNDGDEAIRLIAALARYVPQFIALAAASPFHRGVDTGFDSCRLNMVAAFPLSGRMPELATWADFETFYARLERLGVVSSIKDLYWDIRPQPDIGTLEIRVPDTPLDITCATDLAAYAQALAMRLRDRPAPEHMDDYVYRHNRFQAARFGLDGQLIAGPLGERISVREDILRTLRLLGEEGSRVGASDALERIRRCAEERRNGARWLREALEPAGSLPEMMRAAAQRLEEGCATRSSGDTASTPS